MRQYKPKYNVLLLAILQAVFVKAVFVNQFCFLWTPVLLRQHCVLCNNFSHSFKQNKTKPKPKQEKNPKNREGLKKYNKEYNVLLYLQLYVTISTLTACSSSSVNGLKSKLLLYF